MHFLQANTGNPEWHRYVYNISKETENIIKQAKHNKNVKSSAYFTETTIFDEQLGHTPIHKCNPSGMLFFL